MAERKVINKWFPPDYDPSKVSRSKVSKGQTPKLQPVRLMTPFNMKCTACGEYIGKGRKFNGRKDIADERYYTIPIYRFFLRCTRCSSEITFKTDPKNQTFQSEKGAKRNFEPWRSQNAEQEEIEAERLDRFEREEVNTLEELEGKAVDARKEMEIADALDHIRTRNACHEKLQKRDTEHNGPASVDGERSRMDKEDEEASKRAFRTGAGRVSGRLEREGVANDEWDPGPRSTGLSEGNDHTQTEPPPKFERSVKKRRKDLSAALGIRKKAPLL